jgi:hypothetical protein
MHVSKIDYHSDHRFTSYLSNVFQNFFFADNIYQSSSYAFSKIIFYKKAE